VAVFVAAQFADGGKLCVEETGSGAKVEVNTCSSTSTAQKWTIGTDGTVKAAGFCLDTAANSTTSGAGVVAEVCSTDATQKWRVTSTGTLVNAAKSTLCLTDPSASATKGTQLTATTCGGKGQTWTTVTTGALPTGQTQTLTYDAEGRTATVTTPSGTPAAPAPTCTTPTATCWSRPRLSAAPTRRVSCTSSAARSS
jgi:YD repeat-containing protein